VQRPGAHAHIRSRYMRNIFLPLSLSVLSPFPAPLPAAGPRSLRGGGQRKHMASFCPPSCGGTLSLPFSPATAAVASVAAGLHTLAARGGAGLGRWPRLFKVRTGGVKECR
jgi:hypothetical protein